MGRGREDIGPRADSPERGRRAPADLAGVEARRPRSGPGEEQRRDDQSAAGGDDVSMAGGWRKAAGALGLLPEDAAEDARGRDPAAGGGGASPVEAVTPERGHEDARGQGERRK